MKSFLISSVLMLGSIAHLFAADQFNIDPAHSSIGFGVKHMLVSTVKGSFTEYQGAIVYDAKEVANSSVEVVIKTASIDTANAKRDDHLRNDDFFSAAKYPEITFKSTKIRKSKEGLFADGTLTMRGKAKRITIPFKILGPIQDPWGNTRMGIEANLSIDRRDWGISWSKTLDQGGLVVANNVAIDLAIEAIKAKPEAEQSKRPKS